MAADLELAFELARVDQHRQRAALLFMALDAHRHLLQVRVVDPDVGAVGDDHLREGLHHLPAELARRAQLERAAGRFQQLAVGRVHALLEVRRHAGHAGTEGVELLARTGVGQGCGKGKHQDHDKAHGHNLGCIAGQCVAACLNGAWGA